MKLYRKHPGIPPKKRQIGRYCMCKNTTKRVTPLIPEVRVHFWRGGEERRPSFTCACEKLLLKGGGICEDLFETFNSGVAIQSLHRVPSILCQLHTRTKTNREQIMAPWVPNILYVIAPKVSPKVCAVLIFSCCWHGNSCLPIGVSEGAIFLSRLWRATCIRLQQDLFTALLAMSSTVFNKPSENLANLYNICKVWNTLRNNLQL